MQAQTKAQSFEDRSLEQRMAALREANRIRTYRAQLKEDLRWGRQSARALLLDPPAEIETMKVVDLLLSIRKVGRTKVNKIMVQNRISPSKTVGGLSERQRGELVGALGKYATSRAAWQS